MKTYTLSVDAFGESSEITETIAYLNQAFPSLLRNSVAEYINDSNIQNSSDEKQRNKLAVIMAFDEINVKDGEDVAHNRMQKVFQAGRDKQQETLGLIFTATAEYLDSHNVNIEAAIENGLLVEVNSITLSRVEVKLLLNLLTHRCTDKTEYDLAAPLIEKLNASRI